MSENHEQAVNEAMLLLEWGSVMQGSEISRVEWAITRAQMEARPTEEVLAMSHDLAASIGGLLHGAPDGLVWGTQEHRDRMIARVMGDVRFGRSPRANPPALGQDAHAFVRREIVDRAIEALAAQATAYVPASCLDSAAPDGHDRYDLPPDATPEQADWWKRGYAQAILDAREAIDDEIEEEEESE